MAVFVEVCREEAFDFGGGDFLEPLTLLNCGCLGGFAADPVAVLDGSPGGCTSRFILFAPGSNYSFVDGPLTRVAPLRAALRPARRDAIGSPDCRERRGAGETLLNRGGFASIRLRLRRGCHQSIRQFRDMLQTTSYVQVVESQSTDVRRSNVHTGELAMTLCLKGAVAAAAISTRVTWKLAGKTGNALEVPKMLKEDLRAGGSYISYQLEMFET